MENPNNEQTLKSLQEMLSRLLSEYQTMDADLKNRELVINSIKTTIQALTNPSSLSSTPSHNGTPILSQKIFSYSTLTSWRGKIIAFMKYKNKAVTTTEAVDAIAEIEKKYTPKQVLNLVSGSMSAMVKDGVVKTYKPKKMKGAYYASPAWFDDNGNLKEEYKPDMKEQVIW